MNFQGDSLTSTTILNFPSGTACPATNPQHDALFAELASLPLLRHAIVQLLIHGTVNLVRKSGLAPRRSKNECKLNRRNSRRELTVPSQRQQTKAAHYILSLDEARCYGDWNAVPELIRKIRKHAPERICTSNPISNK